MADKYREFISSWRAHGNFLSHTTDSELSNMLTRSSNLTSRNRDDGSYAPRDWDPPSWYLTTWPEHTLHDSDAVRFGVKLCVAHMMTERTHGLCSFCGCQFGDILQNDKSRHNFQQTMIFFRYTFQVNALSANHRMRFSDYFEKETLLSSCTFYVFTEILGPILVLRFTAAHLNISVLKLKIWG